MRLLEPFLYGVRLWRQSARSWSAELSGILVLAAAIALVTTLFDASDGLVPRLVEAPIPLGPWSQSWTSGMRPPSSEQEAAIAHWSATAAVIAGLLALLAIGTLAGSWTQRRRANHLRHNVAWSTGADRGQLLAERVGELGPWAVIAAACSTVVVSVLPALVDGTFPGALGAGESPALFAGIALVVLLAAGLVGERRAIADAPHFSAPFRPIAAGLQTPAFLIGLGFAVASSAGLLLLHSEGPRFSTGGGDGVEVEVLRASVLPRIADERGTILRKWLQPQENGLPVGAASTGTLRGIGVRDIAWVECGACSSGGLPTPIKVVRPELFAVGPDTFPFLGIEVVEGRAFEYAGAVEGGPAEAIVSRRMARANFEGGRAVGRRLRLGDTNAEWLTVVGVATDRPGAGGQTDIAVYLSLEAAAPTEVEFLIPGGSGAVASFERTVPAGVDVREAHSGRSEYSDRRWFAVLFSILAAIGLLLIAGGARHAAARDARAHRLDVAVRRALGARRRHVYLFLARRIGWQVAIGLGIGVFLSVGVAANLQRVAVDLPIVDMRVWTVAALLVLGASLSGFGAEVRLSLLEPPAKGLDDL